MSGLARTGSESGLNQKALRSVGGEGVPAPVVTCVQAALKPGSIQWAGGVERGAIQSIATATTTVAGAIRRRRVGVLLMIGRPPRPTHISYTAPTNREG